MSRTMVEPPTRPYLTASISTRETTLFAYRFMLRSLGAIVRLVWLPTLIQILILYISLNVYLLELATFLQQPDSQIAGQALGILVGGIFGALFFAGIAIVAIVELASGNQSKPGWVYLRISRIEWRFYAAAVRLFIILVSFVAIAVAVFWGVANTLDISPTGTVFWLGNAALIMGMFYLFLRLGFLIPPLAVAQSEKILRRCWRLTAQSVWSLAPIMLVLIIPGIALQIAAEFFLRVGGMIPAPALGFSLNDFAVAGHGILPYALLVMMVSYLAVVVPLTVGAVVVHRTLAEREEGKHP